MATQLSVDKPPVGDANYTPTSLPELTLAASAMVQLILDPMIVIAFNPHLTSLKPSTGPPALDSCKLISWYTYLCLHITKVDHAWGVKYLYI